MQQINDQIMNILSLISTPPDTTQIVLSIGIALGMALIMWVAYRVANNAGTYQPRFAVTLVSLALLSTILMDLVQSNLALSLGMLGSLSIVRFRTNIKDPRDIGFIFWAMAIGLAVATGSYTIGITGSVVIAVAMILTAHHSNPASEMMLVIRGSESDLDNIGTIICNGCTRSQVKAKNIMADSFELVYDISISTQNSNTLIKDLFALKGIDTVNLLAEAKNMY